MHHTEKVKRTASFVERVLYFCIKLYLSYEVWIFSFKLPFHERKLKGKCIWSRICNRSPERCRFYRDQKIL